MPDQPRPRTNIDAQRVKAARAAMWNDVLANQVGAPNRTITNLTLVAANPALTPAEVAALADAAAMLRDMSEGYTQRY
jgi:hypothetical protein